MGCEERGENSSSQKDNLTIHSLDKRGAGGELVKVNLSDGSFFFVLNEVLITEVLHQGDSLGFERISSLKEKSETLRAEKKALSLLARSSHSAGALRLKLLKRGFDSPVIDRILTDLTGKGYLSDRLFAEEWLRIRLRKHPEGRSLLIAGLLKRGVAREIAEQTVDSVFSLEVEWECARSLAEKLKRRSDLSKRELEAKLFYRRFRPQVIREITR